MTHKLGWILLTLAISISASAAVNPGTISGEVRNSTGTPQMGAAVEVLVQAASQGLVVYTDAKGRYTAHGLLPGQYTVKVSAPSFLPTIREHVGLQSGANLVVNLTLNTLFEAIQFVPKKANSNEDQDDWRWTLRSVANRPVLRLAGDGPLVVVHEKDDNSGVLKAKVAFMAGSDGQAFSGSDMSTQFAFEQSVFGRNLVSLNGDVGSAPGTPTMLRAKYSRQLSNGSRPEISLTAKRFASPEMVARHEALQAMAITVSNNTTLTPSMELNYGGDAQAVQFMGTSVAYRPFAALDYHINDNTVAQYKYTSSVPTMRTDRGFDGAPVDLSEGSPRVSLVNGDAKIERASHNEISLSRRVGKNNFQLAGYHDNLQNTALTGVGTFGTQESDVLGDAYTGTFLYNGGTMSTSGVRAVYQRKLFAHSAATVDYSYGGVLTAPEQFLSLSDVRANLRVQNRHSVAAKYSQTIPGAKTSVVTSYRWTNGDALTPVDMFNTSAGEADAGVNVFIRQPLPNRRFIPAGMEALVDVRNLLAQGYRPVLSTDGQTLYLVQMARSVRGGLSFTF